MLMRYSLALAALALLLAAAPGAHAQYLVKDINPGTGDSDFRGMARLGDAYLFAADDGEHGLELWRTDGTEAGTYLVKDIYEGEESGVFYYVGLEHDGAHYFFADDGVHGSELWKTDGTTEGTELVADLTPGAEGTQPIWPVMWDGVIYFPRRNTANEGELWKLDIDQQEFGFVATVGTAGFSFHPRGEFLLFFSSTEANGLELWRTDGTEEGTYIVREIGPGSADGVNVNNALGEVNGITLFSGYLFDNQGESIGAGLWRTDGTEAGTTLLLGPPQLEVQSRFMGFASDGATLLFGGQNAEQGHELWGTDGTQAGTRLIKDIVPGEASSYPSSMSAPLFAGFSGVTSGERRLWTTDGTEEGTVIVGDSGPCYGGIVAAGAAEIVFYNGKPDPTVHDTQDCELWVSDGTDSGTRRLLDIWPGPGSSYPSFLIADENFVLMEASDPVHGRELWAVEPGSVVSAEETGEASSQEIGMGAPTPNPFRIEATVTLDVDRPQRVRTEVFDVLGRRVAVLHDGPLATGTHAFTVDGAALPPGLYVVRAAGESDTASRRLTLVR